MTHGEKLQAQIIWAPQVHVQRPKMTGIQNWTACLKGALPQERNSSYTYSSEMPVRSQGGKKSTNLLI